MYLVECECENTPMLWNDRSQTNQKARLSNSLNLTNLDFYVCLVDEKNEECNSVVAGHPSLKNA